MPTLSNEVIFAHAILVEHLNGNLRLIAHKLELKVIVPHCILSTIFMNLGLVLCGPNRYYGIGILFSKDLCLLQTLGTGHCDIQPPRWHPVSTDSGPMGYLPRKNLQISEAAKLRD
mmetsp:Transcript_24934/g.69535  ORF Transcript_24934/g.69535 Transcript_24934/m.69535 type:complete len:116 (+) Transcript_24934:642-989(+)